MTEHKIENNLTIDVINLFRLKKKETQQLKTIYAEILELFLIQKKKIIINC